MIYTETLTPETYFKNSRDFQLFGRIYDFIFNYAKTNVDLMDNFPISNTAETKLIELLCRTLGFENSTDYRADDLNAVCMVFINLIKNKGTLSAVKKLVATILNIEGISKEYLVIKEYGIKIPTIGIYVPDMAQNSELKLLEDILDYIIPAGVNFVIHNASVSNIDMNYLTTTDNVGVSAIVDRNDEIADGNQMELTEKVNGPKISPESGDIRYSKLYKEK